MKIELHADGLAIPPEVSHTSRILVTGQLAPAAPVGVPVIAVIVDQANRQLRQVKAKLLELVHQLPAGAKLALLAVADRESRPLLPMTELATETDRSAAAKAIDALPEKSSGYSDLMVGWLRACEHAALGASEKQLGRCILVTSGEGQWHERDRDNFARHAEALRTRGVVTSVLATEGEGSRLMWLQRIGDAGGGGVYMTDDRSSLPAELGRALPVQVSAAVLEVEAAGAQRVAIGGVALQTAKQRWCLPLGNLAAGMQLVHLLEIDWPAQAASPARTVRVRIREQRGNMPAPYATCDLNAQASKNVPAILTRRLILTELYRAFRRHEELMQSEQYQLAQLVIFDSIAWLNTFVAESPVEKAALDYVLQRFELSFKREKKERLLRRPDELELSGGALEEFSARLFPADESLFGPVHAAASSLTASGLPPFRYAVHDVLKGDFENVRRLTSGEELELVAQVARLTGVKLIITRHHLVDNWFSHWYAKERTAVISSFGWEGMSTLPLRAFLAYEIVLHGYLGRNPGFDFYNFYHYETRGCWGDFCGHKPELEIKLQTGHICDFCRRSLQQNGFRDLGELERLVARVRELAFPVSHVG